MDQIRLGLIAQGKSLSIIKSEMERHQRVFTREVMGPDIWNDSATTVRSGWKGQE